MKQNWKNLYFTSEYTAITHQWFRPIQKIGMFVQEISKNNLKKSTNTDIVIVEIRICFTRFFLPNKNPFKIKIMLFKICNIIYCYWIAYLKCKFCEYISFLIVWQFYLIGLSSHTHPWYNFHVHWIHGS